MSNQEESNEPDAPAIISSPLDLSESARDFMESHQKERQLSPLQEQLADLTVRFLTDPTGEHREIVDRARKDQKDKLFARIFWKFVDARALREIWDHQPDWPTINATVFRYPWQEGIGAITEGDYIQFLQHSEPFARALAMAVEAVRQEAGENSKSSGGMGSPKQVLQLVPSGVKPSRHSQRRQIVRRVVRSKADLKDREKVKKLFAELDAAGEPLSKLRGVSRARQTAHTWSELIGKEPHAEYQHRITVLESDLTHPKSRS